MDNAHWITFLLAGYERFQGDLGQLFDYYVKLKPYNAMQETMKTLGNIELLKYKLLHSPHAYTGLFKLGLMGWFGIQFGIIPSKYKKTVEKILMGSGFAAVTLIGSGPTENPTPYRSSGFGGSGNSPSWGYKA